MHASTDAPRKVTGDAPWALFDVASTRQIEQRALQTAPTPGLMQRAGLAVARLALAMAPHAQRIWIAAGPGNNGGDGIEAALHLHAWGKGVTVTWLGAPESAPADARAAYERARQAGVAFADAPPDHWDLCVDALLGIGAARAPTGTMAQWIDRMRGSDAPVLAVDVPTGLNADTGHAHTPCVRASATLCLLTLKPGLFTADGRDSTREVWLDDLGIDPAQICPQAPARAWLIGASAALAPAHASHKGSFGDVAIVGGAPGMAGAAVLAASAALHRGAGRVYLSLLGARPDALVMAEPELMMRDVGALDAQQMTIVCGCGGGDAVRAPLATLVSRAPRMVIDADGLNAVAADAQLQTQLLARSARNWQTILTPHPLEAARLLGTTAGAVQQDRLRAAEQLAQAYQAVVVLKGSGTVVAAPGRAPAINPLGNARLATAGTGDVLAGAIGAGLAAGLDAFDAACQAVYAHAYCADHWPSGAALTASRLARALQRPGMGSGVAFCR